MVSNQGSRQLHHNDINLHACHFFGLDKRDNVTFFIDANDDRILLKRSTVWKQ